MELLTPIGSGDTIRNYWMKELQRQDQTWRLPGERQGMVGWEAWVEVQLTGGVTGQYHILPIAELHHWLGSAYRALIPSEDSS